MKKFHSRMIATFLFPVVLVVSGCGSKQEHEDGDGHDHGSKSAEAKKSEEKHEDHDDESSGATYQEGKGLSLSEETKKSLDLELAEVGKQEITPTLSLTAQIYRAAEEAPRLHARERSGKAYATALVPTVLREKLASGRTLNFTAKNRNGSPSEGVVWKIDPAQVALLGKAEVLLELSDGEHSLAVGDFVEATIPLDDKRKTLVIPRSALLETSTGNCVFVQKMDFLLRTEIQTGMRTDNFIEITAGLYEGDIVVVKPVEALHLIELRATKGGGHSH